MSGNGAGLRQWHNDRWFHLVGNHGCGRRRCGHRRRDGNFVGVGGNAHGFAGLRVGFGFVSQSRQHSCGKDDGVNVNPCFHGREFSRHAVKSHGRNQSFFIEQLLGLSPPPPEMPRQRPKRLYGRSWNFPAAGRWHSSLSVAQRRFWVERERRWFTSMAQRPVVSPRW